MKTTYTMNKTAEEVLQDLPYAYDGMIGKEVPLSERMFFGKDILKAMPDLAASLHPAPAKTGEETADNGKGDDGLTLDAPDRLHEAKYHAVEYAGFWHIQAGPYYGDTDILDAEQVGEDEAEKNAMLIAKLLNATSPITEVKDSGVVDVREVASKAFSAGEHYGYSSSDRSSACTAPSKEQYLNSLPSPALSTEVVYRWVKASERLPVEYGLYPGNIFEKGDGKKSWFYTQLFFNGFEFTDTKENWEIEWLEQLPHTITTANKETK